MRCEYCWQPWQHERAEQCHVHIWPTICCCVWCNCASKVDATCSSATGSVQLSHPGTTEGLGGSAAAHAAQQGPSNSSHSRKLTAQIAAQGVKGTGAGFVSGKKTPCIAFAHLHAGICTLCKHCGNICSSIRTLHIHANRSTKPSQTGLNARPHSAATHIVWRAHS